MLPGIHNLKEYVTPDLESMVIAPSIFGLKELTQAQVIAPSFRLDFMHPLTTA